MEKTVSTDCEIQQLAEFDYDFSTLPPHVLAQIIYNLEIADFKIASQTCKSWYYASCDPRISEYLHLYFTLEPTDSMDIFVRPVTKLHFEYINFDNFDYKKLLRNFGDKITELHINSCNRLRMTQLFEIFIYLSNLKVLRLNYGTRYYKPDNFSKHRRITNQTRRIMRNLGQVEELHITTIEKDLKGAEIILNYCTNLKSLYWNENLNHEFYDNFLHEVLVNRNFGCTSECLESLTVHTIDRKQNSKFFEHLTNLNLRNLRSIDLKEINETYYDVMFKEFCKTYNKLERLTMYGCNDQQMADICKYMRDLKTVNLDDVTATNLRLLGFLTRLENFTIRRIAGSTDDRSSALIDFFRLKPKNLTDIKIDSVNLVVLKELCENLPQLKRLHLEYVDTKECEPIFRHLTKLEQLHLEFAESNTINSKLIESDPEWNVTKLAELKDLYVSTFLPGFTPDLIVKLPKLISKHHDYVYDPPEDADEENENENEEENSEEDTDEDIEGVANELVIEPIAEEVVIYRPPPSSLFIKIATYFYKFGSWSNHLRLIYILTSGIVHTINWTRKKIAGPQELKEENTNTIIESDIDANEPIAEEGTEEEKNREYELSEFVVFSEWFSDT